MKNIIYNLISIKRVGNGLRPTLRIKATHSADAVTANYTYSISFLVRYMKHEL